MGTPGGSSTRRLVDDDRVWSTEGVGEEAVLAEFADEAALTRSSAPTAVPLESHGRRLRGPRLLDPRTPLRDVARMVLVGCLSSMALGASFAIGFGYVWSDRAPVTSSATPEERPGARGWLPFQLMPSRGPAANPAAPEAARPTGAQAASPSKPPSATSSGIQTPGPSKLAASGRAAPGRDGGTVDTSGSPPRSPAREEAPSSTARGTESTLPSEPVLAPKSANIGTPSLPSSVTPRPSYAPTRNAPAMAAPASGESTAVRRRTDVDAVRDTIQRYQTAYSGKDLGAMALVWPSLDIVGTARVFADIDQQTLTFTDCRVTTAGNLATAVCPGQVRYVGRVGGRQLRERRGMWTIALERDDDTWTFVRLNVQ